MEGDFALVELEGGFAGQYKGGVTSYDRAKGDLRRLLADTSAAVVTTMLDYYGLPSDFPGMASRPGSPDPFVRVAHVEDEFARDVGHQRFVPYLSLHEFEASVFADLDQCLYLFGDERVVQRLKDMRAVAATPEHINDGPTTAPSKRILSVFAGYQKVVHGIQAAKAVGLAKLRSECAHFDAWVQRLEAA